MSHTWYRILLPLVCLPLLMAGKCLDSDTNPLDPAEQEEFVRSVELIFTTSTTQCLHLLAPGEDFPTGQLCSDGTVNVRRSSVPLTLKVGRSYTFRAGRQGQILQSITCELIEGPSFTSHGLQYYRDFGVGNPGFINAGGFDCPNQT